MFNRDKILNALADSGVQCDDCLTTNTAIPQRSTVNLDCNLLARRGELIREQSICPQCRRCKLVNRLTGKVDAHRHITNREKVISALMPSLEKCDACLTEDTKIPWHSTVYQECVLLARRGQLIRECKICPACKSGRMKHVNRLTHTRKK